MISCWIFAAVVASYSIAQIVMSIFQCTPVRKAWRPATPGTCLDTFVAATTPASINVVADFATVFLPMPLIWGMQMQWRRKVQLIGIFMLGGLWVFPSSLASAKSLTWTQSVIFASIWRAATMKLLSHKDASYTNVDPCIWSIVENGIGKLPSPLLAGVYAEIHDPPEGIVSTCLPTLRPLYAVVIRGHYCKANEYCTRCQHSSEGANTTANPRALNLWRSTSTGERTDSDHSRMPGSMSTVDTKKDVESRWNLPEIKGHQETRLFSIIDRPL